MEHPVRRLKYSERKRFGLKSEQGWLAHEKGPPRAVDRGYPTGNSPTIGGGDEQSEWDERDNEKVGGVQMNGFTYGFIDELTKIGAEDVKPEGGGTTTGTAGAAEGPGWFRRRWEGIKAEPGKWGAGFSGVGREAKKGWQTGAWAPAAGKPGPGFFSRLAGGAKGVLGGVGQSKRLMLAGGGLTAAGGLGLGYMLGRHRKKKQEE